MPTYQYRCRECGKSFERTETISEHENAKVRCPKCEPFAGYPRFDAGARGFVGIARQPDEPGQRLGEADDMLPGTGTNFERDALLWENAKSAPLGSAHNCARPTAITVARPSPRRGAGDGWCLTCRYVI